MTRSAAARRAGISSMYSRISKRLSCAMPSFSLKAAKSAFSMLPVAWMWRKFRFASSHTARSATRSFSTCAPSDPPNETITICPGCTPRARRAAARSARNISARTGLPTTTVLSGAPRRSTASGMAASTALACFANILFVTPGNAFCS